MSVGSVLALAALMVAIWLGVRISRVPPEFVVTRSRTIPNVAASKVYPQLCDFNAWKKWTPWYEKDPDQKFEVTGKPCTVGHKQEWDGNMEVGKGYAEITELKKNELVRTKLVFSEPFASTSPGALHLEARGSDAVVTWSMSGHNSFLERIMFGVLGLDLEQMVGLDFEKGLESLEALVKK